MQNAIVEEHKVAEQRTTTRRTLDVLPLGVFLTEHLLWSPSPHVFWQQAWAKRDLHGQGGVLEELQRLLLWWGVFMDFESPGATNDFAATVFSADNHLIIWSALLIIWKAATCLMPRRLLWSSPLLPHDVPASCSQVGLCWTGLDPGGTENFSIFNWKTIFDVWWSDIFFNKEMWCLCFPSMVAAPQPVILTTQESHSWRREPPSMDRSSCLSFPQSFA